MTDRYVVVGNPVAHSVSPQIHTEFSRQTGQDIDYARLLAPFDAFAATILKFRDEGGAGVNVTLPFKRAAWELVKEHAGCALAAEAVNTIDFRDGRMIGHNTDGTGLVADLENNLNFRIGGKRVLLMGAGGAAYGVMQPLLKLQPESLVVANRTLAKALDLVAHFQQYEKSAARGVSARPYEELAGAQFDLVINATSAGLSDKMPPLPAGCFAPGALAYDMVYRKQTPFVKFAVEQGVRLSDGLGMLVEQAAESFFIWRGVRPATTPVIAKLRSGPGIS